MTTRDCRGQLLPIAVIALVLLMFASAAIAHITMASWRSTLRVDADAETANILASATNIVDAVVVRYGPQQASARIGTGWHSLPDRAGCVGTVLEGCWTAEFTEDTEQVTVPGRVTPVDLPVWTVTVAAAARCDRMPTSVADAKELCEAVTSDATGTRRAAVLVYETAAPLPVFPTLLHSGRLWPDEPDNPPITSCADGATPPAHGAAVWCAIPVLSRPPADAYDDPANRLRVEADHIAGAGLFVNTEGRGLVLTCAAGRCEAADPGEHRTLAHGTEDLALPEGACTATPAVWDWAETGHNAATRSHDDWELQWDSELVSFVTALAGSWSVSDVRTEWANTVTAASLNEVTDDDIQAVISTVPSTLDEKRVAEALAELAGGTAPHDPGTVLEADETTEVLLSGRPDGGMALAKGIIRITGDILAPADEPLVIASGCHIIVGECVMDHYAYDPVSLSFVTTETEATSDLYAELQHCEDPDPVDYLTVGAPVLGSMRLASTNITLENVIIVAAGGVWAADLEPNSDQAIACAYDTGDAAPALSIVGSIISGHAGATSRWHDCDNNLLTPIAVGSDGREAIVAGYDRTSSLPSDTTGWAEANIAWWPGRDDGIWRRR